MYNYHRIHAKYRLMYNEIKIGDGSVDYRQQADGTTLAVFELLPFPSLEDIKDLTLQKKRDWQEKSEIIFTDETAVKEEHVINKLWNSWMFSGLSDTKAIRLELYRDSYSFDLVKGDQKINYSIIHEKFGFSDEKGTPHVLVRKSDGTHFNDINSDISDQEIISIIKATEGL